MPLTVTPWSRRALFFVNDLIAGTGDGSTVNVGPSITPWPVVTRTGPPVGPGAGTAVTVPALSSTLEAAVAAELDAGDVGERCWPLILTGCPTTPCDGESFETEPGEYDATQSRSAFDHSSWRSYSWPLITWLCFEPFVRSAAVVLGALVAVLAASDEVLGVEPAAERARGR